MEQTKSPKPHTMTMGLSLIAIAISLFSLYFSREAFKLNRNTSRAVVQVTSIELRSDWAATSANGAHVRPIKIELRLTNSGKSLATGISGFISVNVSYLPALKTTNIAIGTIGARLSPDDLGPGATRAYQMELSPPDLAQPQNLLGEITGISVIPSFGYSDATGIYNDELCFSAKADNSIIKAGTIHPCNTVARGSVTIP